MRDNANRYHINYDSNEASHAKLAEINIRRFLGREKELLERLKILDIWSAESIDIEYFLEICDRQVICKLWAIEHLMAWISGAKRFNIDHK